MLRIQTDRLDLIAADATLTEAGIEGSEKLSVLLHAQVDAGWPPDDLAEVLPLFLEMLRNDPNRFGWLHWYGILRQPEPVLVGSGGFRGIPDKAGKVEIGYSVNPEFRQRGIASEMVCALSRWAFGQPGVLCIEAETSSDNTGSLGVLHGCGFREFGPGAEAGHIRFILVEEWISMK
jgi:RimJ/RimL family protein N-acetyltransferase